jgi:hypothetical protein
MFVNIIRGGFFYDYHKHCATLCFLVLKYMYSLLVSSEAPCRLRVYSRLPRLQSQVPKYICTYSGLYLFILNSMYCQITQRTYTHTHTHTRACTRAPPLPHSKSYVTSKSIYHCVSQQMSHLLSWQNYCHTWHRHGLSRCCGVLKTSAFLTWNLRVRT